MMINGRVVSHFMEYCNYKECYWFKYCTRCKFSDYRVATLRSTAEVSQEFCTVITGQLKMKLAEEVACNTTVIKHYKTLRYYDASGRLKHKPTTALHGHPSFMYLLVLISSTTSYF